MSVFRRLAGRIRKPKKEAEEAEEDPMPEFSTPAEEVTVTPLTTPPDYVATRREPTPVGTLVAEPEKLQIDAAATQDLAKAAHIEPQTAAEIVPGRALKRDKEGRIHIKIVFYGPSLSGKTTALRWLFANVRSISKGKIVEIHDELGRTTFFDFVPISASHKVVFDVFTVAGQRRHASQRISVLREVDGLIFMADSQPEQMNENIASMQELRIALGTDRMATLPIVVSLNKRDLPNALPIDYMLQMLGLEGYPVFDTIATEGKNLLRMFQRVLRDALIFKVGI
ncbi:MAG: GTPase domain-containing protein [Candidatus Thorarchaeota archaeon]|nr:MAG: GTPase domain-containing protein [Candidatus Thorarchaeota archaeon]